MKKILRSYLDKKHPALSHQLRVLREERQFRAIVPQPTPYGFQFAGNATMVSGTFEPEETQSIQHLLEQTDVLVDVGANIGFYACLARFKGKKVLAFEPSSSNLSYLYTNFLSNDFHDIEVFPMGLSDEAGIVVLYGMGTGASLLEGWAEGAASHGQAISVTTMDTVLQNRFADQKLLIKIDVEGVEYSVLKGAKKTLSRSNPPVWMVEVCLTEHHPDGLNPHFQEVFELFWRFGYHAFPVGLEDREVSAADVAQWVAERKRSFGHISYLFKK